MELLRIRVLTKRKRGYIFYADPNSDPYWEYNAKARLINTCIKYFPEVTKISTWSLSSSQGSNIEIIKSKERGGKSAQIALKSTKIYKETSNSKAWMAEIVLLVHSCLHLSNAKSFGATVCFPCFLTWKFWVGFFLHLDKGFNPPSELRY